MHANKHPAGPVLTIGMVDETDRENIVASLPYAVRVTLVIDGDHYDVKTVSKFQFSAPDYVRKVND